MSLFKTAAITVAGIAAGVAYKKVRKNSSKKAAAATTVTVWASAHAVAGAKKLAEQKAAKAAAEAVATTKVVEEVAAKAAEETATKVATKVATNTAKASLSYKAGTVIVNMMASTAAGMGTKAIAKRMGASENKSRFIGDSAAVLVDLAMCTRMSPIGGFIMAGIATYSFFRSMDQYYAIEMKQVVTA